MILEVALLDVKQGQQAAFETAFAEAQQIVSGMSGYLSHQLQKCIEKDNRYLLLVNWETLADHQVGFCQSAEYQQWRELLHHFYENFPDVEHFTTLYPNEA